MWLHFPLRGDAIESKEHAPKQTERKSTKKDDKTAVTDRAKVAKAKRALYEYWKDYRMKWHQSIGMGAEKYRFHDHENLAHYANAATDIEFKFPFGFKELEGIHSRTDFDLKAHQEYSGKKIQFFDFEETF